MSTFNVLFSVKYLKLPSEFKAKELSDPNKISPVGTFVTPVPPYKTLSVGKTASFKSNGPFILPSSNRKSETCSNFEPSELANNTHFGINIFIPVPPRAIGRIPPLILLASKLVILHPFPYILDALIEPSTSNK